MTDPLFNLDGKRIYVAGHKGMAGSAIVRRLEGEACEILVADRSELDLRRQEATENWLKSAVPDVVIVAAARVGGIFANNSRPVDFLFDNLAIELNLIHASHSIGVQKLLFLGSSCIYPKFSKQPISEDQLLTGELESTSQWYSIAKIAGVKLCQAYRQQFGRDFISVMPTNLYGPDDNYHPTNSHVVAALIRRIHEAKIVGAPTVSAWGTGRPRREFLYVDDFADACIFLLKNYSSTEIINIGFGEDISIGELAALVAKIIGYHGEVVFDPSKPDGMLRKQVDVSRLSTLGWTAKVPLQEGLCRAYVDFLKGSIRER